MQSPYLPPGVTQDDLDGPEEPEDGPQTSQPSDAAWRRMTRLEREAWLADHD